MLGGFELCLSFTEKLPEIESIQPGELFESMQDEIILLKPIISTDELSIKLGLCSFNKYRQKPAAGQAIRITFKDKPEPFYIKDITFVDIDGNVISGQTEISDPSHYIGSIPDKCILYQNYPNPFNPVTEIPVEIREPGLASLTVYNLKGEQIRTIFKRILEPGKHTYVWDGKNDFGEKVGSGMYVYVLQSGSVKLMKKMIFMK